MRSGERSDHEERHLYSVHVEQSHFSFLRFYIAYMRRARDIRMMINLLNHAGCAGIRCSWYMSHSKEQPNINSKDLVTRVHIHTHTYIHKVRLSYEFFSAVSCLNIINYWNLSRMHNKKERVTKRVRERYFINNTVAINYSKTLSNTNRVVYYYELKSSIFI